MRMNKIITMIIMFSLPNNATYYSLVYNFHVCYLLVSKPIAKSPLECHKISNIILI